MKRHSKNRKTKSTVRVANRRSRSKVIKVNQEAKPLVSKTTASILVVDDELDTVRALEKILKKRDYKIQVAFDGLEALSKLHNDHFDLVITDLLMPKLDGTQLLRRIRKEWPTLPVVVITAVDDEHTHHELLSMGVSAYLRKPFERKQLFDAVAEIIQPSGTEVTAYGTEVPAYLEDFANSAESTKRLALVGVCG